MITGELKSKIDHIWDTMWPGRRRPGHGTRHRSWIATGRSTRAATLPATSNGSTKPSVTAARTAVKAEEVQTYLEGLKANRGGPERPVSAQTFNRHFGTLRSLFGWLERQEEIERNPMDKVERRKLGERLSRPKVATNYAAIRPDQRGVGILNTMKIRSIRWATVFGLGLPILVGGVAVAQPTTTNVVAGSGKVLDAGWADTPDYEKSEKARGAIDGMRSLVSRVLAHREEARGERDVIKLKCVNEKLTGIKGHLRSSEQASLTLEYALARGDAGVARHEFEKIMVAKTKCDELSAGSERCIGQLEPSVSPERRGPVVGEGVGEVVGQGRGVIGEDRRGQPEGQQQ